jgi:multiple sugar transport system permease protein
VASVARNAIREPGVAANARRTLREMRREWTAYASLAPGFLIFTAFTLFVVIFSLYLSFHQWNILEPAKPYVGLQNYEQLGHDADLRTAIWNTLYYTVGSVPLTMIAGLAIALLLNQQIRARGLFRTMYYLPVVTPLVVASIVWKWVYGGDFGLLNYYLIKSSMIDKPLLWLSDVHLAMPAVIIMSVWKSAGFAMVVYLAGLQAIPEELYEAATVDGAGAWQKLRTITIPLLAPTTLFLLVIQVIGSFQVFTQIFILTNGGPINATTTIVYYIYQQGFKYFQMGYASAVAYVLLGMLFIFTLIQIRLYSRRVEF